MKNLNIITNLKKYVGMRNIKTALAVAVSVVISDIFKLQSPFFVATSALISMETTVKKGIHAGISRVLGTIIGGCLGVIAVLIHPGNVFLIFTGIVILITLLNLLNWQDSISIACVVFCVIMITMSSENIVFYAFQRTFDTIVGIIISIFINYIISPPVDSKFSKEADLNE
ncbi:MAG: aromatic acid exporter family protein [Clostridium sp.]|uniref:FUSC family protein n=1 Tax=Clostridium sp. TaxID=1506 RepID=UPI002FC63DFF